MTITTGPVVLAKHASPRQISQRQQDKNKEKAKSFFCSTQESTGTKQTTHHPAKIRLRVSKQRNYTELTIYRFDIFISPRPAMRNRVTERFGSIIIITIDRSRLTRKMCR
ncbi:hypothetical protein AVEN_49605-1 [Araneus ventricosus]|uniref:Uncharacterized protein n=1 Tax=Araneus ventricosus TaxID=182803 RepID=A0A4Y2IE46_ARAVE|nr:hypothetical protein AVEN_49605-1 [Araneus ventricosus]